RRVGLIGIDFGLIAAPRPLWPCLPCPPAPRPIRPRHARSARATLDLHGPHPICPRRAPSPPSTSRLPAPQAALNPAASGSRHGGSEARATPDGRRKTSLPRLSGLVYYRKSDRRKYGLSRASSEGAVAKSDARAPRC